MEWNATFMCNFKTKHKISKKVPALSGHWSGVGGKGGVPVPLLSISCILTTESENPGGYNLGPAHQHHVPHCRVGSGLSVLHSESATLPSGAKSIKYPF